LDDLGADGVGLRSKHDGIYQSTRRSNRCTRSSTDSELRASCIRRRRGWPGVRRLAARRCSAVGARVPVRDDASSRESRRDRHAAAILARPLHPHARRRVRLECRQPERRSPSIRRRLRVEPLAASCEVCLVVGAVTMRLHRGERATIVVDLAYLGVAAFVAWGRFGPSPSRADR
jgi:hypothetical protein